MFDQLAPELGATYFNTHSRTIGVVVGYETRRKSWVTIRYRGRDHEIPFHWLGQYWVRCNRLGEPL